MTHICIDNLTIIGSDNGLSPGRRQAIIWTNAGILLIGPLGTNYSEILIEIHTFTFRKMHFKMSSAKWRLFGLGLNVLKREIIPTFRIEVFWGIYLPFNRVTFDVVMGWRVLLPWHWSTNVYLFPFQSTEITFDDIPMERTKLPFKNVIKKVVCTIPAISFRSKSFNRVGPRHNRRHCTHILQLIFLNKNHNF